MLVMQTMLLGTAFSSDRVDQLLEMDNISALDSIQSKLTILKQAQLSLQMAELHLAKKATGESVYLRFERIGGTMVIAGIIAGYNSLYFPPGLRAMISANISVRGIKSGLIALNEEDAAYVLQEIKSLEVKVKDAQKVLKKESQYYCKKVASHDICN